MKITAYNTGVKKIIGYTDSVQECECCGKTELKGTYCLEIDGVELYYGSTCAFKVHGVSNDEKKEAVNAFKKAAKNKSLYDQHIAPLKKELSEKLKNGFTTDYENLTGIAKKVYHQMEHNHELFIQSVAKKYKIAL